MRTVSHICYVHQRNHLTTNLDGSIYLDVMDDAILAAGVLPEDKLLFETLVTIVTLSPDMASVS